MENKPVETTYYHLKRCPVELALEVIGGKWRIPILWKLSDAKTVRYNELKRSISGITNTMLTRSLQDLERHGLVKRIEYSEVPPHVEYSLTDTCQRLIPALKIINEWGKSI
ncbi:winged helix-turn-helix transcriptional regulator [Clostridium saccharoperbutylacetonicum]|uniref:winged helix-turn-helix transcriptional regulator n=1 Tax=Clostridium saccharoperbutylacetonicum TaxID=36745 RepID=UPI0039EAE885